MDTTAHDQRKSLLVELGEVSVAISNTRARLGWERQWRKDVRRRARLAGITDEEMREVEGIATAQARGMGPGGDARGSRHR